MSNYIKMRCEDCGAIMEADRDKQILFCPYCGSKKLIEESDDVKKAKIESETRIHEADKNAEMVHDRSSADASQAKSKMMESIFGNGQGAAVCLALVAGLILIFMMIAW